MPRTTMHAGQAPTDAELVRRLVVRQFPGWVGLPVHPVASAGTDHDLYRLGDDLVVRLPLVAAATGQAAREATWLPRLAPSLPLAVPQPVALGEPDAGYPHAWSVYRWLPGADARALARGDQAAHQLAAQDLAAFVRALHRIDTAGAPARTPGSRGGPLADLDAGVRASVDALGDRVDAAAVLAAWAESVSVPPWTGADVWLHGDLLPGNLLLTAAGSRRSSTSACSPSATRPSTCCRPGTCSTPPAAGSSCPPSAPTRPPGSAAAGGRWPRR